MRFRCSGNGCPIRGPLCIHSGRLLGGGGGMQPVPLSCRLPCGSVCVSTICTCPHYRVPRVHGACPGGTSPFGYTHNPHLEGSSTASHSCPCLVITVHAAQPVPTHARMNVCTQFYSSSPSSPYLNKTTWASCRTNRNVKIGTASASQTMCLAT